MDENIYVEIEVPPQYAELLEQQTAERGVSAEEIVTQAIRKMIERSIANAGE